MDGEGLWSNGTRGTVELSVDLQDVAGVWWLRSEMSKSSSLFVVSEAVVVVAIVNGAFVSDGSEVVTVPQYLDEQVQS